MRKINSIILHCSASNNPDHDDIAVIRQWHLDKGWRDIGYHFFIRSNGVIEKGRDVIHSGAHAKGFNANSIGICLHGLFETDFTENQFEQCAKLIKALKINFPGIKTVIPHSFVNKGKECPVFDVYKEIYSRI